MNALVVGAGEMGRWLVAVLEDAGASDVAVADRERTAAEAVDGARAVALDTDETFALVCVAVPIPAAEGAIASAADTASEALLDVTGTMARPVAAMREHAPDLERVSLHPLFASDTEPGNVAVVADRPGPVTDAVRETLADRGNDCFETTPEEHDEAMETVQARAHAAIIAYAMAAEAVPEQFHTPVSTTLSGLADRVTGGEGRVYADIQAAFDGADDVAEAARALAEADTDTFLELYDQL